MPTQLPDPFAQAILIKEKRKADAKAILAGPNRVFPQYLVAPIVAALASNYMGDYGFDGQVMGILLSCGLVALIVNTYECWAMRRRLEAAITLLNLQEGV